MDQLEDDANGVSKVPIKSFTLVIYFLITVAANLAERSKFVSETGTGIILITVCIAQKNESVAIMIALYEPVPYP